MPDVKTVVQREELESLIEVAKASQIIVRSCSEVSKPRFTTVDSFHIAIGHWCDTALHSRKTLLECLCFAACYAVRRTLHNAFTAR